MFYSYEVGWQNAIARPFTPSLMHLIIAAGAAETPYDMICMCNVCVHAVLLGIGFVTYQ